MATPSTRATFKEYCLRALGKPVIEINVDPDQVDDRIDEALQYFAQYHYDGIERMYLKHQITAAELARAATNTTTSATDTADGSISADWLEGKGFIPIPSPVVSIVQVFPFDDSSTNNMFDMRYQIRLNDLYDFSSTSLVHYEMTMNQLDHLSHLLVGEKPLRFNQHQNRLYIDMDWTNDVNEGEYIVIECFRKVDPDTFTDIWDDIFLKKYATQLIKRQWGANLSKFQGILMLGGVQMNGEQIYMQAQEEINKLEEQIQLAFELPPMHMIG